MLAVARNNMFKIRQHHQKWNLLLRNLSQQEILPRVTIDKEGKKAEVIIPGFSYGDLDRVGNVNIWKLALMSEGARIIMWMKGQSSALADMLDVLPDNKLVVLGGARYRVSDAFYNRSHYYNPVRYEYSIAGYGQTSYQQHAEAFSTVTGDLLYSEDCFNVVIDKASRRPAIVGDVIKNYIAENFMEPTGTVVAPVAPLTKPEGCFTRHTRLEWSQSDGFRHTNQAQYVKMTYDAATVFALQHGFENVKGDLADRRVWMIEMAYKGETHPGDVLDVHAWEMEKDGGAGKEGVVEEAGGEGTQGATLGFQIDKAGKPVFQSRMELAS